jgi:hypothetical protein
MQAWLELNPSHFRHLLDLDYGHHSPMRDLGEAEIAATIILTPSLCPWNMQATE